MATAGASAPSWEAFTASLTAIDRAIANVRAVNVNAVATRDAAKLLIQQYFRETRPELASLGTPDDELAVMDGYMQSLLQLANGRNAKTSYVRLLRQIRAETQRLELAREYRIGEQRRQAVPPAGVILSSVELSIISTLAELVPSAALSYEQAVRDLETSDRLSYRGTANELREALRETLDRLAPDDEVIAAAGFKLERGQTAPTQKQKVRHILRSRNMPSAARKAPEDTVSLVEELTSSLTRSSYQRTSLSAHVASSRREVIQLKMYVDSVLAELLQVHG